jgi:hypothetical protein
MFHTMPLSMLEWAIVVGVASTVLWVDELGKLVRRAMANG